MLVTMLGQSREHVYWLKYQCRDIISWIGGGPRSTVGVAMEEEGVVDGSPPPLTLINTQLIANHKQH